MAKTYLVEVHIENPQTHTLAKSGKPFQIVAKHDDAAKAEARARVESMRLPPVRSIHFSGSNKLLVYCSEPERRAQPLPGQVWKKPPRAE